MSDTLGRSFERLPAPVRGVARELLRYPRVCYALRSVQMRLQQLTGSEASRTIEPSRIEGFERYEHLFADSDRNIAEILRPWRDEFRWTVGRTNNGTFESVDIELYHAMLRTRRPELVIEIGGGHSTGFSTAALRRNGGGHVIVIDPSPRVRLPRGVTHIEAPVQDVDLEIFGRLGPQDVLFIDSSHSTEEARYHVDRILPMLRPGVTVHHHDVLYPFAVYYLGDRERFGEPDVLLDFYARNVGRFDVLVSSSYAVARNRPLVAELAPSMRWQPNRIPGSLWTRRRDQSGAGTGQ